MILGWNKGCQWEKSSFLFLVRFLPRLGRFLFNLFLFFFLISAMEWWVLNKTLSEPSSPYIHYMGYKKNWLNNESNARCILKSGSLNPTYQIAYQTKNGKTVSKVRGFTLYHRGLKKINFDAMCNQVCRPCGEPNCVEIPNFIKRDPKTKTLHRTRIKKQYNLVYD